MRICCFVLCVFICSELSAEPWEWSGHLKLEGTGASYPDDSIYQTVYGDRSVLYAGQGRLALHKRLSAWQFDVHYQWHLLHQDHLGAGAVYLQGKLLPDDDTRFFDLTQSHWFDDDTALVHRLDRLSATYAAPNWVAKVGRQALSWGNGLAYAPMDFINPFAPTAVSREYKQGDDMIYGQYLFDSGDDLQCVWVVRRDVESERVASDQATYALKYHGFNDWLEFDLLIARHYDKSVIGVGGNRSLGGALWRFDVVWSQTDDDPVVSGVTSISYSWQWFDRNLNGALEYFYNGYGIGNGDYSPERLVNEPALAQRIGRGELYTLAKHYLMANLTVEVTPLLTVTPAWFVNLDDHSSLFQLGANYSLSDESQCLFVLNYPLGDEGSEYEGVASSLPGQYYSQGPSAFAQIAWYF